MGSFGTGDMICTAHIPFDTFCSQFLTTLSPYFRVVSSRVGGRMWWNYRCIFPPFQGALSQHARGMYWLHRPFILLLFFDIGGCLQVSTYVGFLKGKVGQHVRVQTCTVVLRKLADRATFLSGVIRPSERRMKFWKDMNRNMVLHSAI